MASYVTRYETKNGKTRRAKDLGAADPAAAETTATPATPKGADNNQTPGKPSGNPAKEGA